jgi:site-specific DNA-methyltransferase (adenine-specific)
MLELNKLYNMDCMEGMKEFPDKYFELAITDPPYGIGIGTMNYTTSGAVRTHGHAAAKRRDYRSKGNWDIKPEKSYFDELRRVSKNQIIWGGNYFSDMLPPSKSFIIWDKRVSDTMRNDFADCEYAWCSKGVARMFRYLWNGMLQGNMKDKEIRFHPTQKPVDLYKWILAEKQDYAKQGDKILDTHVGSASSLIACYNYGFDYIGFEIDDEICHKAQARMDAVMAQVSLF